ncbi:MAG: hypothetical protein PHV12_03650, partial [Bacteroidales bacterium]|jgi:hypothetical protein|nr:hypothetical protein [Bacteroidales bacterium]MDD3272796.1 hypothetical protein [Bacteroidales bacterium]MDD4058884.1 hypothetical protein [Bacteroidales bacterium]
MKKTLITLTILLAMPFMAKAFGFGENQPSPKMNFYGIDFTLVKTFGVKEDAGKTALAFEAINKLIVTETKKYQYGNFFKKYIRQIAQTTDLGRIESLGFDNVNIDEAIFKARVMDEEGMPTYNKAYKIDDADLARLIKGFNTGKDTGYGVLYVAELLNKEDSMGNFIAVFFDVRTKKIIFADRVAGKAGGFGMRNYWASPLEKIFKM